MRIGILAFRQEPFISANTAIAYAVGAEIARTDTVVYIGRQQIPDQKTNASHDGNLICYLNKKPYSDFSRASNILMKFGWNRIGLFSDWWRLRRIVKEQKLDALICMTAPNENALIVQAARLSIPCYLYQLDPFYNWMDHEDARLKARFHTLINTFDHVFTTELLMDVYRKDESFKSSLSRFSVLQFPKMVKPAGENDVRREHGETTRLLYTGSLYHDIRNPRILIDLKAVLPSEAEIIFCGGCDRPEDMDMLINAGITCKGYCDQQTLTEEKSKADVLINIGNTVKNQLGSKIIEYIATGKPIINLAQFENCPTIDVLKSYNNCITIQTHYISEEAEHINSFIDSTNKRKIPWELVEERYYDYTPKYVAEQMIHKIKASF